MVLPLLLCDEGDGWGDGGGGSYAGTFLPNPWQGFTSVGLAPSLPSSSCCNKFDWDGCCAPFSFLFLAMVVGKEWTGSIRSPGVGSPDLLVSVFNLPVCDHRGDGDAEHERIYTGGPSELRGIDAQGADGQQLQFLMLVLSQVIYKLLWQIVGIAIFTIEQDQNSKFSCTRLCWYDDMHVLTPSLLFGLILR